MPKQITARVFKPDSETTFLLTPPPPHPKKDESRDLCLWECQEKVHQKQRQVDVLYLPVLIDAGRLGHWCDGATCS